ncbi:MAG: acyltransferase [Planctomycetota bacterium]
MRALLREIEYLSVLFSRRLWGFERGACARLGSVTSRLVPRILRHYGATVGSDVRVASPLVVHNAERTFANLTLKDGAYIGRDCLIDLKQKIEIGARVTLAMRVTIITHMDVGRSSWSERGYPASSAPVTIGDDAYIGAGAIILPGVRIGAGALVGAASLVRHDVPAGARVGGVPARELGPGMRS